MLKIYFSKGKILFDIFRFGTTINLSPGTSTTDVTGKNKFHIRPKQEIHPHSLYLADGPFQCDPFLKLHDQIKQVKFERNFITVNLYLTSNRKWTTECSTNLCQYVKHGFWYIFV